jgi:hypothetical protein
MPKIEINHIDLDVALENVVASIALQEAALSRILNAEGGKIQYAIDGANGFDYQQILDCNNSVNTLLQSVSNLENSLSIKLSCSVQKLVRHAGIENAINETNKTAADSFDRAEIPRAALGVDINPADNERWLTARVDGNPATDGSGESIDRLYLRRLRKLRSPARKAFVHPKNPSGEAGGNLPPHLMDKRYFHGSDQECCWSADGEQRSGFIRTEWEISKENELIWMLPMSAFAGLFAAFEEGRTPAVKGGRKCSITIDARVARRDPQRQFITYGQPSNILRIKPVPALI